MYRYDARHPKTKPGKDKVLWFYKEDFVGHRPCRLKDGRIRTSTHDFADEQELRAFIKNLMSTYWYQGQDGSFEKLMPNAVPLTHAIQRWLGAMAHLDELCPEGGISDIAVDIACGHVQGSTSSEARNASSTSHIFALAPGEEDCEQFYPLDYNFETCPAALQDGDVDRSLLRSARPELSTFISSYPLTSNQANILSTVLGNIDHINLERLFKNLMPSFAEAVECGVARKIANEDSMADYQDVEEWMLDIFEDVEAHGIGSLPTLRQVLSKSTTVQLWK